MTILVRLLCSTVVATAILPVAAFADENPDFRTMDVPNEVYVCESLDQLKTLNLTGEQREKLNAILDEWKTDFLTDKAEYESRPKDKRRGEYGQRRDNSLKNAISDLLDDRQHQLFHQMLTLWFQSPVQSRHVFRFELGLSDQQHLQLQDLETKWILHGLEAPCDYRYQRHTEKPDRSNYGYGKLRAYGYAVTRLAWQFAAERNAEWNKILTAAQAKRWKERELQVAFRTNRFGILLVDFSSSRQGRDQLSTGTWLDHTVPYFVPPFEALKWSDGQLPQVRTLVKAVTVSFDDLPADREERIEWIEAHRKREKECMRQIEDVMTAEQRATWWKLIGEPPANYPFLRELKANSLTVTKPADTNNLPDRDKP